MEPVISIIVPIYNGEKYIDQIINSMVMQTRQNFEVICIDDGSTDRTAPILDEYEKKHAWLKCIHRKNGGLSAARNTGIDNSRGQYIMFMDADDFYETRTIEEVTDRIQRFNPDMLDFGILYNYAENSKNPGHTGLSKEILLGQQVIKERIIPHMINVKYDPEAFIFDYVWNKVYRSDIIKNNDIRFLETRRTWEDRIFVAQYLQYIKSYYSIDKYLYNYVSVENSLSRKYDLQFFDIILENYDIYHSLYSNEYDFENLYVAEYWSKSIEKMIARSIEEKQNKDIIYQNIYKTLTNEIVIGWFLNREINTHSDRKVNSLVLQADIDGLIKFYKKEKVKSLISKHYKFRRNQMVRLLKRIMKR